MDIEPRLKMRKTIKVMDHQNAVHNSNCCIDFECVIKGHPHWNIQGQTWASLHYIHVFLEISCRKENTHTRILADKAFDLHSLMRS